MSVSSQDFGCLPEIQYSKQALKFLAKLNNRFKFGRVVLIRKIDNRGDIYKGA